MDRKSEHGEAGAPFATSPSSWLARLQLRFAKSQQRTILAAREHSGPLVVQKALYPEGDGICHAVIVHPPGGIAGGDQLQLHVQLDEAAHALLTTPGAGKWYKANGLTASQSLRFAIAQDALLEWLPQETILFDAAQVRMRAHIELAGNARYAGWEVVCLGRRAAAEQFKTGRWQQHLEIFRDGEMIWGDYADVCGDDPLLLSPVGMCGRSVVGRLVIAAGITPPDILAQCREVTGSNDDLFAVSALPEIFVATYLGDNAEAVRGYFERLWQVLRPWYANVAAQRPRIWNT
ncbi:MAG TPA: urease accessory protein UreD [Spongiibacteraceae bacterium]|nr:urease accessory protein UreD [Spongiibacteraceae bacterium]